MSARFVCRYACRCGKVAASGTVSGTTGRLIAVDLLLAAREAGRRGRSVQCAASTRECVGYNGTMVEDPCCAWAAKEAAVGVDGDEGDDLEDETANTCVGNDAEGGTLAVGRSGASTVGGRRDLGKELGIESKVTAAIIL